MEREQHDLFLNPIDPQLITTKLTIPPLYLKRIVPRSHVYTLLNTSRERPLTLVTAPAGFGKTTLVSEWLRQQTCPAAWVSLEPTDNEPVRFWRYVVQALHHAYPNSDIHLSLHALAAHEQGEPFLTVLINALVQLHTEIILVLDDYHTITDPVIQQGLIFLLEHLPPQLHLFLLTRHEPPLPLARLRVQSKLVEIRTPHLRFTPREVSTFLTQAMELPLSATESNTLAQHTEGWIAGLQLAALSLQQSLENPQSDIQLPTRENIHKDIHSAINQFINTFTCTNKYINKYIVDYLTDEVLAQQTTEVQRFLLETSILEHFTASLCDAVTGQSSSETILEHLEQGNVFINALDHQQHWYRYDQLFAELLHYHLKQNTTPEVEAELQPYTHSHSHTNTAVTTHLSAEYICTLHQRASHWYAQHGMPVDAIQHMLAANAYEQAANMIEQHAWTYIQRGEVQLVHSWLIQLPAQSFVLRPMLTFLHAYTLFYQAQIADCEQALALIEQLWQQAGHPELLSYVYDLRALIALTRGDGAQAIQQARLALAHNQDDDWLRSDALISLAAGHLVAGDLTAATQLINDSSLLKQKTSFAPLLQRISIYQGEIALKQGNLPAAHQIFQHLQLEHTAGTPRNNGVVCTYLATIYREWNDLAAAQEQIQQALALTEQIDDEGLFSARRFIVAARIAWVQEDKAHAFSLLDLAEQNIQRCGGNARLLAQITELRVQFLLQNRKSADAQQWYQQYVPENLAQLPSIEQEYWRRAQIRLLLEAGQGKQAQELLIPLLQAAQQQERKADMFTLLILQTLAYYIEGNTHLTLQTLERALELGEPGGCLRSFVDEGAVMVALLSELYNRYQRRPANEQTQPIALLPPTPAIPQSPLETPKGDYTLPASIPPDITRHSKKLPSWSGDFSLGYVYTLLYSFGTEIQPPLWLISQGSEESLIDKLSEREYRVLGLIAEGLSNQEIAQKLVVTVSTIKTHLNNIYAKLHVHTRLQAVTKAYSLGLLRRSEADIQTH
jgi:ATP-dependent transcriptional regulator